MTDDLPVDIDTESSSDDEGTELWKWIAGAGGVVVGIYLLAWLFELLVGLVGFLVYYGAIALLVYGAYRGVKYMLSEEESTMVDEPVALPDDIDVEGELEGGDLESELQDMSVDVESPDVAVDRDDELERKFAELEEQMNE